MMVWAPFAKSPNCASQSTRASGRSTEYPYSNPIAANSDSEESYTQNFAWSAARYCSGVHSAPVRRSCSTAWRWTNVPRRESCPASRTGVPSMSSEPNARISPKPQSTGPSRDISSRLASRASSLVCTVNPSGTRRWARPTRCRTSGVTAERQPTIVPASSCWDSGFSSPARVSAVSSGTRGVSLVSANTRSSWSW